MPKRYSGRKIIKTLEKAGFYQISQKGSHIKLRGLRKGQLLTIERWQLEHFKASSDKRR